MKLLERVFLRLWHEYRGVLTGFFLDDDSATLEYGDRELVIRVTNTTRRKIQSILVPSNIGRAVHVLHTDIPGEPYLLRVPSQ